MINKLKVFSLLFCSDDDKVSVIDDNEQWIVAKQKAATKYSKVNTP